MARARLCVGVRFRPQGRSLEHGLDCVGLVAIALRARDVRSDYALRGGSIATIEAGLAAAGMAAVDVPHPGDVLVLRAGPEQWHLGIATDAGFIHADAGLRCVVETPGTPVWPQAGVWRQSFKRRKAR